MVVVSSTFTAPVEGVFQQTPDTKMFVNGEEYGTGTLYITEANVIWNGKLSSLGGPNGTVSLLYPNISLHAIQREPTPALYMVINFEMNLSGLSSAEAAESNLDDDFDVDDHPITQLRFVPQDETALQSLYAAMVQGQSLHPDIAQSMDDEFFGIEEDDDDEFEDAEEIEPDTTEAEQRLRQLRLENSNGTHYEDCEDAELEE